MTNTPQSGLPVSFAEQYNDANQRIQTRLADGGYWLYEYDNLGQVISGKRYWSNFTIIYSFGTKVDEARQPSAGLVEDGDGSLLGTSFAGGAANFGTVFKIGKDGSGYQTLHDFVAGSGDGMRSRSVLTPGAPGVYYSATLSGGRDGYGVVYQLTIPELVRASTNSGIKGPPISGSSPPPIRSRSFPAAEPSRGQ